jgi:tetratricopeptide (TPR) repeat protein
MDDYDGAVRDYTRALYLKPDYLNALVGRGNAHVARGKLEDAALDFEAALKNKPDLPSAHSGLGLVAAQRGDWPAAEAAYRKAVAADARDGGALRGLAVSLWRQNKREDALKTYREAAVVAPATRLIWLETAQLCVELHQLEDALVALNRALEALPTDTASRRMRAAVHVQRKEIKLAMSDYDQIIAADPKETEAAIELAALLTGGDSDARARAIEYVKAAAQRGATADALRKDERLAGLRANTRFDDAVQGK